MIKGSSLTIVCDILGPWDTPEEAVEFLLSKHTPLELEELSEVHNVHWYNAKKGKISKKLLATLEELGAVASSTRIRLAADVTEEQRDALQALALESGHESWSAFCQWMANEYMKVVEQESVYV